MDFYIFFIFRIFSDTVAHLLYISQMEYDEHPSMLDRVSEQSANSPYGDNLEQLRTRTTSTNTSPKMSEPQSQCQGQTQRTTSVLTNMDAHVSKFTVLAFAIGHVQNDMAACCWFTYLLIYLENAVMFHPAAAGVVMLSGQIFDAIATPVVGLLSDSSSSFSCCGFRFCKRTKFHFFGTVLVTVCFTGVWIYSPFDGCPECEVGDIYQTIYYATAAALFNVGWASVQVSHLALITDLAADENIRTR